MEPGDKARIARSRLLIVGAGELGFLFARQALEVGFRRIVVADQFSVGYGEVGIYGEAAVGTMNRAKALIAALDQYPDASLAYHDDSPATIDGWNYDIAVGCMLSPHERLRVNSCCCKYGVVYIDGCASGRRQRMQDVFSVGPCIECVGLSGNMVIAEPPDMRTLQMLAHRMVEEAVHIALNDLDGCISGVLYMDADGSEDVLEAGVSPNCPNHSLAWRQSR